ncbi:glycosyltransferase family 69 protein [Thermothielavioides terrestris NRRL 8126]|uniref:Glycosyltransferase family 69 protein n=1 Tax=Thermothielavioides terrestris (strain ATCC 38088 / NRRL 8126) TaxID=578455 RepID=G2QV33_THETT|nr:glycosyltransferase family 69 protein [Thermothielavioides terrestris NRRL 8126]AEO64631.1 glycosyltransferase family 69 protein [Thermothielavioides terrestris NRRL 8126]
MRKPLLFVAPATCLFLVFLGLYLRREQLAQVPRPKFLRPDGEPRQAASTAVADEPSTATATTRHETLPQETRASYINSIMDPDADDPPRLHCPKLDPSRYQHLQIGNEEPVSTGIRYFFALDLRQCLPLLPRLIGSVVEAIRFLGPEHCALSIVEGNSDDGTGEVLAALRPNLEALGTTYYFSTSDINPKEADRIKRLAALRNLAIQPILDAARSAPNNEKKPTFSSNTTVVFLNDVAICAEDILELAHQRDHLGADMVCGMDWTYVGRDPTFYDVWVARTLAGGDSFFEIPPDGSWDSAWNLFWNDGAARARFRAHRPFQVFSCWNGAAVFSAAPLLEHAVRFRAPRQGECYQGEPQLFCKDLWFYGYRRIAVVPAVNLEYSNEAGAKIKEAKGYTSRWVGAPGLEDDTIEWQKEPPEKIKCIPSYDKQFFEVWNKTQPGT